ncbi:CatB-related O-acetyltransferase [Cohnella sp. GCM10020058]|uniref:CatB-related O-acetyltransferase n=1 Tax=Cohnella sp. GCM10020058 TaxID=3317330 RepID=UPI003637DB21
MTVYEGPGAVLELLKLQYPAREDPGRGIRLGAFTYGNPKINMYTNDGRLSIGKFCSIAENVTIFLGGEHRIDWLTTYPFTALAPAIAAIPGHPATKGDVVIGNDVWIADGAAILSGVQIGDGAVIGARAVVARDVPPYGIAAGNPARTVKHRFAPDEIAGLLAIRWWDWDLARLEPAVPLLLNGDAAALLKYAADTDELN